MMEGALAFVAVVFGLGQAQAAPTAAPNLLADPIGASASPASPWQVVGLPRQDIPFTAYRIVEIDGSRVLQVDAQASYGNLVHEWTAGIEARQLSWRWRIEVDNPKTDIQSRGGDDHAAAVCAMFDQPLAALPFWERQMLRLARALSGQVLPAATVCYVWDARQPTGALLESPYTRRVRWMVLRGAGEGLGQWRSEERDLHADFVRLFGDESRAVPRLRAIVVAGDADNTRGRSLAHLGNLVLR